MQCKFTPFVVCAITMLIHSVRGLCDYNANSLRAWFVR